MKLFSGERVIDAGSDPVAAESASRGSAPADDAIAGDRGIPSINRVTSIQSRTSSVLAITFMSTLGLGLLAWYYAKTLTRPAQAQHAAQAAVKSHAQGEMTLPPLPPIELPFIRKEPRPRLQRMHQGLDGFSLSKRRSRGVFRVPHTNAGGGARLASGAQRVAASHSDANGRRLPPADAAISSVEGYGRCRARSIRKTAVGRS